MGRRPTSKGCSPPATCRITTTARPSPLPVPVAWPPLRPNGSSPDTKADASLGFPAYFLVDVIAFPTIREHTQGFGSLMREFLLRLSENKRLAPFIINNGVSRRVARRFVAGETLDDGLAAAAEVNRTFRLAQLHPPCGSTASTYLAKTFLTKPRRASLPPDTATCSTASPVSGWTPTSP